MPTATVLLSSVTLPTGVSCAPTAVVTNSASPVVTARRTETLDDIPFLLRLLRAFLRHWRHGAPQGFAGPSDLGPIEAAQSRGARIRTDLPDTRASVSLARAASWPFHLGPGPKSYSGARRT